MKHTLRISALVLCALTCSQYTYAQTTTRTITYKIPNEARLKKSGMPKELLNQSVEISIKLTNGRLIFKNIAPGKSIEIKYQGTIKGLSASLSINPRKGDVFAQADRTTLSISPTNRTIDIIMRGEYSKQPTLVVESVDPVGGRYKAEHVQEEYRWVRILTISERNI